MSSKQRRAKNPDTPEVKSKYYLTNDKLLPAVLTAKGEGRVTDELGRMLMMIARNYSKHPYFSGWSFKEDMISEALINLCQNALKFNPEKSNNPFAFYTTCVHHSFLQFLNTERKHRNIRDKMLIELGENPSFNYLQNYDDANHQRTQAGHSGDYREEVRELSANIVEARERQKLLAEQEAAKRAKEAAEAAALAAASATQDIIIETLSSSEPEDSLPSSGVIQYDKE